MDDPAQADGVSQVKSVVPITPEKWMVESHYLKHGKWEPGHGAAYEPAPDRKVKFR